MDLLWTTTTKETNVHQLKFLIPMDLQIHGYWVLVSFVLWTLCLQVCSSFSYMCIQVQNNEYMFAFPKTRERIIFYTHRNTVVLLCKF